MCNTKVDEGLFRSYATYASTPQAMFLNDNETAIDLLQYEPIAKCVVALVEGTGAAPITIGLHGDWGAGKSSVLVMVEAAMQGRNSVLCLRFNGWTFQGFEDAKVAMLQSIVSEIEKARPGQVVLKQKAVALLKRINWLKVAKKAGGLGFNLVTGLPSPDQISDLTGIAKTLVAKGRAALTDTDAEGIMTASEGFLKEAEEPPANVPMEISQFREDFKSLLAEAKIQQLVILVDDLDRCLPNTVIETLEAIRLFLFVENSAFVIAVDEAMVEYAVRQHFPDLPSSVSASNYARNYLEKLIQVPLRIPALGPAETRTYVALLLLEKQLPGSRAFAPYLSLARELLAQPWKSHGLDRSAVEAKLGNVPKEAENALTLAAQVTPLLTEGTKGNPRQVKRFLNALILRERIAEARGFLKDIQRPALAKLMLLERFAPEAYDQIVVALGSATDGKLPELARMEGKREEAKAAEMSNGGGTKVRETEESFADWAENTVLTGWLRLEPKMGELDLRPYVFVTRDKRTFSGAAASLGSLAPLFERLAAGGITVSRAKADVAKLKEGEARLLFNALREAVLNRDELKDKPREAEGIALLAASHRFLQGLLVEMLAGRTPEKLGAWAASGWNDAMSEAKARSEFVVLLKKWSAQDDNKPLKVTAKMTLTIYEKA